MLIRCVSQTAEETLLRQWAPPISQYSRVMLNVEITARVSHVCSGLGLDEGDVVRL